MDAERQSPESARLPDPARMILLLWERLSLNRDLQAFLVGVAEDLVPFVDGLGTVAFVSDAPHGLFVTHMTRLTNVLPAFAKSG